MSEPFKSEPDFCCFDNGMSRESDSGKQHESVATTGHIFAD